MICKILLFASALIVAIGLVYLMLAFASLFAGVSV